MKRYEKLFTQDVHGMLLLDKPSGYSSNCLLNKIKKLFCAKKAGYVGTLDPLATGMLPICFGEATKFSKYLSNFDKRYTVVAKLGESTDTFDSYGMIMRISSIRCNEEKIEKCLKFFEGKSLQVPPMFSSVKYKGLPLYKYARQGINISIEPRIIYVYSISRLNKDVDIIELDVHCSKGTYIRSLINDIGEYLGCGAHVIDLRRLMVGQYISSSMVKMKTLLEISNNNVLNDSEILNKFYKLLISVESISRNLINYSLIKN